MAMDATDLYALLEVPPEADAEMLAAAYARRQASYSPDLLVDAPAEFQSLAAQRRAALADAYAVLADPRRRAAYDASRASPHAGALLDYRPLPPAHRKERPSPSAPPVAGVAAPAERARRPSIVLPLVVGLGLLSLLLLLVLSGVRVRADSRALATPAIPDLKLPFSEQQLRDARVRAVDSKLAQPWLELGNMLFDNTEQLRERAPLGPQYLGALDGWIQATQAYSRALELGAGPDTRADLALARFYFGVAKQDRRSIDDAVVEAQRAWQQAPDDPRVLFNYGTILLGLTPPRTAEGLQKWQRLITVAPTSPLADQARPLLRVLAPTR